MDGAGKSSIVDFLNIELSKQNFTVIKTREPGGTPLGASLRNMIINQKITDDIDNQNNPNFEIIAPKAEYLLFASDRAQHVHSLVKPALAQGKIVISDRGADSSLAYQGYGKGLDLKIISELNNWIMEETTPDLVIYLKIDYTTAMNRIIKRGERFSSFEKKGTEFFDRVINGFNEIFKSRAQKAPDSILEIDATKSAEDVKKEVFDKILKRMQYKIKLT